ncbi:QRFP-like peptide receptor [Oculina patagonica]
MSPTDIILMVIFSILVVVNLIGNTLVCVVVLRTKSMKIPMNYLLVNLAVADMVFAFFVSPQYIFRPLFQHPGPPLGDFLCKMATGGSLSWIGTAAAVFTLVLIAFERYYSILFPHSNKRRLTPQKAKLGILASWLVAIVSEIPPIVVMKYSTQRNICTEEWPDIRYARSYTLLTFVFDFALPFTLMAVLYGKVIHRLWSGNNSSSSNVVLLQQRKKLTKLLLMVTVLHGVCLLPDTVTYVLSYFGFKYGSTAYKIGTVLVCLNSTVNPFLYSLQSKRFRRALQKLLHWKVTESVESVDLTDKTNANTAIELCSMSRLENPRLS